MAKPYRAKSKRKNFYINSIHDPLTFGEYKGLSLSDLMETDKSYIISLFKDPKYKMPDDEIAKLIRLFEAYNIPAVNKHKRLPTYRIKDTAGNFVGYFVLSQDSRKESENLNPERLTFTLDIKDGSGIASDIIRYDNGR